MDACNPESGPEGERPLGPADLNSSFYDSDPVRYYHSRWVLLMLVGGKNRELDALVKSGIHYDELLIEPGKVIWPSSDEDPAELSFLLIESESLLHQASETLLRLIIAHRTIPEVPWMQVASVRSAGQFKSLVEEYAQPEWSQELSAAHASVVLGRSLGGQADLDQARVATSRLTRHLARLYLDRSSIYNAVKHGLAVQAGPASVSFHPDSRDVPSFSSGGTAITVLEYEDQGAERRWFERTDWVDVRTNLCLTSLALVQMRCVWDVARARYRGAELPGLQVVTSEGLDDVIRGSMAPRGGALMQMRFHVATERRAKEMHRGEAP